MSLNRWIHPQYVEMYNKGTLKDLASDLPFLHAVLPHFLSEEALSMVLLHSQTQKVERAHGKGVASRADWHWGAFSQLEFIKFYLGKEMRSFMSQLLGEEVHLKASSVPQFNIFKPNSKGLPLHTDLCEQVGFVSLLQLSEGYDLGSGGELIFYGQEGQKIVPSRVVEPRMNTFILFKVSSRSFHSVTDMKGSWTRRTISYDWFGREQLRANHG
ncbi:2OG-Fe(II) oxygenase [bacterium]|nr:2OG-Fe(II) oxygenase [bacterium]